MDPKQPRPASLGEIIYAQFHDEQPPVPARERPELERNKNAPDEGAPEPPTPQAPGRNG